MREYLYDLKVEKDSLNKTQKVDCGCQGLEEMKMF